MNVTIAPTSIAPTRRGMLVVAMHAQYPAAATYRSLAMQVVALVESDQDLARDLAYLCERSFAEKRNEHINGVEVLMYRLTAAGVDLYEGITRDPGIVIDRSR